MVDTDKPALVQAFVTSPSVERIDVRVFVGLARTAHPQYRAGPQKGPWQQYYSITEVEQIVRRGKYTAYVPTAGITMVDALLQREDGRKP